MASERDAEIITNLRSNGRMGLTDLSKRTKIPISTLHERIKASKKTGLIKRFVALVDFRRFGYNSRAKIILKVGRDDRERIKDFLMRSDNVNSLYRINNNYDFFVDGVFIDMKEMEDFIDFMERNYRVENVQVFFVLDDLRREEFMTKK